MTKRFASSAIRAELARRMQNQIQLAENSGFSASAIQLILKPGSNPRVKTLESIANALGVDVTLFFVNDQHNSVDFQPLDRAV
jgi:transcriptional regulator with XRE-family HTH domain